MQNLVLELQRLAIRFQKLWEERCGTSGQVYFEHRVSEYREMWRAVARDLGATFNILSEDFWELELGDQTIRINNHQLEFDNPVTLSLAGKKPLVHLLLKQEGIAVPDFMVFRWAEFSTAYQFLDRYPNGCVIKPVDGYGGKGITTLIQTKKECRKAAVLASLCSRDLLMEPQIPGESYRMLVIGGKMVHAVRRSGVRIVGDGEKTIAGLIMSENSRRRREGQEVLDIDRECLFCLKSQRLSLDAIPDKGRSVLIKSIDESSSNRAEVRTVYNEDVTALLCDSIKRDAELAATIVRSEFLGVDAIMMDPSVPLKEGGGVINEVNTTPALHHHYDVQKESYPQIALVAVSHLLRKRLAGVETW